MTTDPLAGFDTGQARAKATAKKAADTQLPKSFYDPPVLAHVRQAALSRLRSPDAVLAATLTRVMALVHPSIVLPPIAGGDASLNMIVGIVATAGGRKSSTVSVAADLITIPDRLALSGQPLGSGEGIAEAYFGMVPAEDDKPFGKQVKKRIRDSVHLYVDEGATIVNLSQRSGSTTSSTLRSAWSGGTLGQLNAGAETKRIVNEHSYRLGLVAAFQFSNAADILGEAEVGTPQRFLWAMTEHSEIGTERHEWPGVIRFRPPPIIEGQRSRVWFDPEIVTEIEDAEIAEASGQVRPNLLDSHRRMMKMKVSAGLALLLDGTLKVTVSHWERAEEWLAVSDRIRDRIADERGRMQIAEAQLAVESHRLKAVSAAVSADLAVEQARESRMEKRAEKMALRIHEGVRLGDYKTRRDAQRKQSQSSAPDLFDFALNLAAANRWIVLGLEGDSEHGSQVLEVGPVRPSL